MREDFSIFPRTVSQLAGPIIQQQLVTVQYTHSRIHGFSEQGWEIFHIPPHRANVYFLSIFPNILTGKYLKSRRKG